MKASQPRRLPGLCFPLGVDAWQSHQAQHHTPKPRNNAQVRRTTLGYVSSWLFETHVPYRAELGDFAIAYSGPSLTDDTTTFLAHCGRAYHLDVNAMRSYSTSRVVERSAQPWTFTNGYNPRHQCTLYIWWTATLGKDGLSEKELDVIHRKKRPRSIMAGCGG